MNTTASRVEVVRVESEHVPALAGFYRRVWDPDATAASVQRARAAAAAANPVTPGEPPPTWIVLQDGIAIAHVTTIPVRLWLNGRERSAHWIKGLWVLPEYQRSSAGFLVLRAATSGVSPALGLVHEPAAIRLFQALGYTDLGGLPNAIRVLRPREVLRRLDLEVLGLGSMSTWLRAALRLGKAAAPLIGPVIGAATAIWSAAASGWSSGLRIDVEAECDRDGIDQLWSSVKGGIRAAPARDARHFAERYGGRPDYRFVHVRSDSRLVGLGVVKAPGDEGDSRLHGIRVASLSDLLHAPGDRGSGLAVLRGAERAARAMSADALLTSASAAAIRPLLERRGYLRLPANLHVLARIPGEAPPPPAGIAEWWLARGDSGGDGSF